jgi:quercetin dioxygenase-like cupin family protein
VTTCAQVSLACGDDAVVGYFRQLVAEKTGIVVTPDISSGQIRALILNFEAQMFAAAADGSLKDENDSYVIRHHFTDGVYAREMHIPAGHVVIGKIHRHEHLNFISKGRAVVLTEAGGLHEVAAGDTLISPVGVKRLLLTREDTVWTVVHATKEKDLDKIEASVIAKSYGELLLLTDSMRGN